MINVIHLAFGLLIGAFARLYVAGNETGGFAASMAVGLAGSFVGGLAGMALGTQHYGNWAGFVMSLIGAFGAVALFQASRQGRGSTIISPARQSAIPPSSAASVTPAFGSSTPPLLQRQVTQTQNRSERRTQSSRDV